MIDRAQTVDIGSLRARVATPEDLIITKAVASRPKDLADIELILEVHSDLNLERVRHWVHEFATVRDAGD
jgi:predicted nucleotidyltransferase